MPLEIIRADITTLSVDAVVCPTNRHLRPGTGVDYAIRSKCGFEIENALSRLGMCEVGDAVYIDGCSLPASYIIYTVGPKWRGGNDGEEEKLRSCYISSLRIASSLSLKTIAFPLISTGYYSFPKELALRTATDAITSYLRDNELTVYLVVYDEKAFRISHELFENVREYIDDNLEETEDFSPSLRFDEPLFKDGESLDDILRFSRDEGFHDMLFRIIREKNIKEVECYKRANIDRKLFSKIRSNDDYRPSKSTALALALSLELKWPELVELVARAGYSMSSSCVGDIIVKYFVEKGEYSVITINQTLFYYDQVLLGQNTL